jgi:hypothetical protein
VLANNRFLGTSAATRVSGLAPSPNALPFFQRLARQQGGYGKTVAVPRGYGAGGLAWPARAGELGADVDAKITLGATGTLLQGRFIDGVAGITLGAIGEVSAVASVVGSASITLGVTGTMQGLASVAGSASIALSASAELTARAAVAGSAGITLGATGTLGATADIAGIAYFSAAAEGEQLTEAGIASAVWTTTLAGAFTGSEAGAELALAVKLLRNKRITDPVTGVQTLYDNDDVTVLLQGDLFEDAAGTQPYQGQGAERAERLV